MTLNEQTSIPSFLPLLQIAHIEFKSFLFSSSQSTCAQRRETLSVRRTTVWVHHKTRRRKGDFTPLIPQKPEMRTWGMNPHNSRPERFIVDMMSSFFSYKLSSSATVIHIMQNNTLNRLEIKMINWQGTWVSICNYVENIQIIALSCFPFLLWSSALLIAFSKIKL